MAQSIRSLEGENQDNIFIFGKNFEITAPMREHILLKLKKMEEMTPPIVGAHVYLSIEREDHKVEIEYRFSHFKVVVNHSHIKKSSAKLDDMYHAIDLAFDKLKRKIRRWKTRIQDHHAKKPYEIEQKALQILDRKTKYLDDINDEIEEIQLQKIEEEFKPPMVLRNKKKVIPLLTVNEASMRIDLSGDNFLVYRSEEDQKIKVMYVRRDHSLGVLEIE
jgi:putative sigma-54 modulation protein